MPLATIAAAHPGGQGKFGIISDYYCSFSGEFMDAPGQRNWSEGTEDPGHPGHQEDVESQPDRLQAPQIPHHPGTGMFTTISPNTRATRGMVKKACRKACSHSRSQAFRNHRRRRSPLRNQLDRGQHRGPSSQQNWQTPSTTTNSFAVAAGDPASGQAPRQICSDQCCSDLAHALRPGPRRSPVSPKYNGQRLVLAC